MKLCDVRDAYYTSTGKLSDNVRQLDLAGIAVIWMFVSVADNGIIAIPLALRLPLGLFVLSLAADVLQYVCTSIVWGCFNRKKEKAGLTEDAEFLAPVSCNLPANIFFWSKTGLALLGYAFILLYMVRMVT